MADGCHRHPERALAGSLVGGGMIRRGCGGPGIEFTWRCFTLLPLMDEEPPLEVEIHGRRPAAAKNPPAERLPSGPPARRPRAHAGPVMMFLSY